MQENIQRAKKQIGEILENCNNLKSIINENKIWNMNDGVNNQESINTNNLEWKKLENRCRRVLDFCKLTNLSNIQGLERKMNEISSKTEVNLYEIDMIIYEFDNIMLGFDNLEFEVKNENIINGQVPTKNILGKDNKKKFSKIFVSHYSGDKEIVGCVIELLEAIGFTHDNMFCSSFPSYDIPFGENSMEYIKNQFNSDVLALFILTKNFFERPICMCEMGAAWVKAGKSIPVVEPSLDYEEIKGVIKDRQGFKISDGEKLNSFYKMLIESFELTNLDMNVWLRKRDSFITRINALISKDESLRCDNAIKIDPEGFYTARIAEVRDVPKKNGKSYNCYKLDGLINKIDMPPVEGESHWLLYEKNKFIDLSVNDKVKFKIDNLTSLNSYPNVQNARNIYPSQLIKL